MRKRRSSAQGGEVHKRRKQKVENVFNKGSSFSRKVLDENSNLQTIHIVNVKSQRDVSQALKADTEGLKLITYSRRSKNAVNESDSPHSSRCNNKIPVLKYSYSRRRKNGQQGRGPHNSSYLSSQDNENDLYNKSLSMIDTAEADCKRMENDNASFSKNAVHDVEKDGGSRMKNMQTSTNIISSDSNSNFHEACRMHPEIIKKPRKRKRSNKKNKASICSNPLPINEKDVSGSIKSEIIDAVEGSELDPEICSKSEKGNVKPNSRRRHRKRRNRAMKETATVSKDDSLDSGQLCDVFPKLLEPKNEDLCQLKCEIPIEEKSITEDGERCPYSSVLDVRDEVMSDTIIAFDNMAMPLQKPTIRYGKKKLLILDLNGLLVDVLYEHHPFQRAPIMVSGKSVYKRPFCEDFLEFCFERFDVGVWSSRQRKNIDVVVNFLFGEKRSRLLFCWDMSKCTPTGFKTLENKHKPLVLKELKKLWNKEDDDLPWEKGDYSPSNTLLIDDSPYKALCNPSYTAIFPSPYDHKNINDYALGLEGDIRMYLEGLAMADNVQSFVKEHPFGQHAIMPGNPCWRFYLQIIEKMNTSFTSAGSC